MLSLSIVFGLAKITDKFNKQANENEYPDVGNKQYEPTPKKPNAPAAPPLVYTNRYRDLLVFVIIHRIELYSHY